MDKWFYYASIRAVSLALCDVFTDLTVKKIDSNGNVLNSTIDVPLKYGLKEKFYLWLNDKKQEIQFPVMALHQTQLQYDANRATSKLEKFYPANTTNNKQSLTEFLNPAPWKFSYTLSIASKFAIETDQILEQILPFFNPFIIIKVQLPEINFEYDAKVILGTVSPENQTTIDMDGTRNILWTLELTVDSWLFKPIKDVNTINKIIIDYISDSEKLQLAQQIIDGTVDPISYKLLERDFYAGLPK